MEHIKNQKPVTFHGSVTNTFLYYNSGMAGDKPQLTWAISANATLSVYGIEMPFSFSFSDKKTNYTQPFNQFGLSPRYKWITVHLGYRNLNFSSFTLSGYTMLGAGLELNPGKFHFGFIWGRFLKSSTSDASQALFYIPVLSRSGFAARIGVGNKKNFADLIVLSAKDDSNTLKKSANDSLTAPAANVVTGLNMHFTIIKPLTLDVEGALSIYTNDLRLPSFGESTTDEWVKRLCNIIILNLSTQYFTAFKSTLKWQKPSYSLALSYARIDPDYKSMGVYYINNDLENITFSPGFYLFKRKFSFNGSLGFQHDNLRGTKMATSSRTIWNVNMSINPVTWFGLDFLYANFSTNQKAGRVPLVDSLKTYNVNRSLSITPRLLFYNAVHVHSIVLSFNQNDFVDKNPQAEGATTRATTAMLNYNLTFNKIQLSLVAGLSYINSHNSLSKTTLTGGYAGVSKSFFKNELFCSLNESVQNSGINSETGWIFNTSASVRYQPHPKHSLTLQVFLVSNTFSNPSSANSYNQTKGDLSYVYTF